MSLELRPWHFPSEITIRIFEMTMPSKSEQYHVILPLTLVCKDWEVLASLLNVEVDVCAREI
jgi:hypothetical protein